MSNQKFENNIVNGTRLLGEVSSPGRCFLVQQREPGRHQVIIIIIITFILIQEKGFTESLLN